MAVVDYAGIQNALVALLTNADWSSVTGLQVTPPIQKVRVYCEAMPAEMALNNMPFVNVRLKETNSELVTISDGYYDTITFDIEIFAFDFTNFTDAATLRDAVLGVARRSLQGARAFHPSLESSSIAGLMKFGAMTPEGTGGHIASVKFPVQAMAYSDPS